MWAKVSKEVLDKAQYIVPLRKTELQIKYAEALVKIDKAINQINEFNKQEGMAMYVDTWEHLKPILEILKEAA